MILQTLSNIWIRKHIFYSFIKNVSRCYRRVKPGNYFAHHNLTSSARVIDLCCSTSVDDIATNEVIDIFDFLIFNNCWYVFDSLCLWQSFLPAYLHEVSFAYGAVSPAFYFLRWIKTWSLAVIRILVFLLWFSFVPRGSEVVIVPIIN
jgi:hypothetical protein